jgi:single-strand DNA-binding protein
MSANISLIGNLGKEPETKITDNGTFIANFSIASNTFRNTPDGRVEKTDWFRVRGVR